jgi:hypothetical protein
LRDGLAHRVVGIRLVIVMHLPSQGQGLHLDPLPAFEDLLSAAVEDISRCQIVQGLVVALVVVVIDELPDTVLQLPGQVIVVQQDLVLQ